MKVGFINAVFTNKLDSFPIGLVSLCTVLQAKGISAKIVDFTKVDANDILSGKGYNHNYISRCAEIICAERFNVVSFYTMANSYHISIKIAEKVKTIDPNCIVIFAGPQANVCGEDTLRYFSFVDMIALGEGESTIFDTVVYASKRLFEKCPSAVIRHGDSIVRTHILPFIENLDDLPFLDYSFVPYVSNFKAFPIEVGRGCPFHCKFCSTKGFWKKQYRLKSSSRIIEEIKEIQRLFGIEKFQFEHDSLTANRKTIVTFCNDLINRNMGITWGCSSRVDVLDGELIDLLSRAGCRAMFLGIETGSASMQKEINKNLRLERVIPIVKLLHHSNIETTCSFIYGFPNETVSDLAQTLKLISDLIAARVKNIQIHKLTILRGTEFYETYKNNLVNSNLTSNFNAGGDGRYYEKFIKECPELFPHFFGIDGLGCTEAHIECFVNNILRLLVSHYPNTYRLIMLQQEGDIFSLYKDMEKCCKELEEESYALLNGALSNQFMARRITEILKTGYFDQHWSGSFINEMFVFESDYLKWLTHPNSIFTKKYHYDLYEYIINGRNAAPPLCETTINIEMRNKRVYMQRLP